eukprot:TRINITY_DN1905_c0_g1_i1.p1 TRINITY_DN1905_c0_g1~~TRINITY_DN1905_c0_g1_i1.p1  ORF type:complete len:516 (+),score=124.30 TRINITY_DN1905_c0_g1_i1:102-1649(+)
MFSGVVRRSAQRLGNHYPWQPPQWQFSGAPMKSIPQHFEVKPPPSWVRVYAASEAPAVRDELPPHQWISAFEYEQAKGQLSTLEKLGLTEALWAFHKDLHYKLVDNADKYLVNNSNLDDYMASEVWNRWVSEANEHFTYQGIMTWRYNCFSAANLEVIPPGPLREEVRWTALIDMHPDDQDKIWNIRQNWLSEQWRITPVADPMRVARLDVASRKALLERIDAFEAEWTNKATGLEKDLVTSYCNQWRDVVHPTRHVTIDAIKQEKDANLLQEWFEEVFADTGDNRMYVIAKRAAELRGDSSAVMLAEWCQGMAARDADAAARAVVPDPAPQAEAATEAAGACLPADFSEITSKSMLDAHLAFYAGHWQRILPIYVASERQMYSDAWAQYEKEARRIGPDGSKLRYAWWKALNGAAAASPYYAPPLLPVRRDRHGTRFMLRMMGALEAQGAFGYNDRDPDYVADSLSFLNFKTLAAGDLEEINEEYPGFGIDWSKVSAEAKARVPDLAKFAENAN